MAASYFFCPRDFCVKDCRGGVSRCRRQWSAKARNLGKPDPNEVRGTPIVVGVI